MKDFNDTEIFASKIVPLLYVGTTRCFTYDPPEPSKVRWGGEVTKLQVLLQIVIFREILLQASVLLNTSEVLNWMVFIHNKNHATLDYSNAFGGQYLSLETGWIPNGRKHVSSATLSLDLDIIQFLDVDENNCPPTPHIKDFDMDKCLAKYYAKTIKCSSPWEDASLVEQFPVCTTASQYKGEQTNIS